MSTTWYLIATLLLSPFASAQIPLDANIDTLYATLKSKHVTNINEAIEHFGPGFFKPEQYLLIFDSFSPQASSPDAPRIILFGKNKQLRIGFNHQTKSGQDLEAIQWRSLTRTWEFREIKFGKNGPRLSRANPKLCLECHTDHQPKLKANILVSLNQSVFGGGSQRFKEKLKSDPIYKKLGSAENSSEFTGP